MALLRYERLYLHTHPLWASSGCSWVSWRSSAGVTAFSFSALPSLLKRPLPIFPIQPQIYKSAFSVYPNLLFILKLGCLLLLSCKCSSYSGYQTFFRYVICKYFLPFCELSFHCIYDFLCFAKAFKFNYVPFIFAFSFITLGGRLKKVLLQFLSKSVLPMFSFKNFIRSFLLFRSLIHLSLFLCLVLENILIYI